MFPPWNLDGLLTATIRTSVMILPSKSAGGCIACDREPRASAMGLFSPHLYGTRFPVLS